MISRWDRGYKFDAARSGDSTRVLVRAESAHLDKMKEKVRGLAEKTQGGIELADLEMVNNLGDLTSGEAGEGEEVETLPSLTKQDSLGSGGEHGRQARLVCDLVELGVSSKEVVQIKTEDGGTRELTHLETAKVCCTSHDDNFLVIQKDGKVSFFLEAL